MGFCPVALFAADKPVQSDTAVVSPAPGERLVAVGDHLRYQVVEDTDPPVELVVSNTGMIDLPYYGPMQAAGRPLRELIAAIKTALEAELYVSATVRMQVLAYSQGAVNRGRVHLSGQVRRVGPVEIDLSEKATLGQTILAAGGLADFGDPRNVRIIRKVDGETRTITVDLREVLSKGRIDKDVELRDGDFVIVDERKINW
jgi:protein involved in polysaccharide export with SLBB domain